MPNAFLIPFSTDPQTIQMGRGTGSGDTYTPPNWASQKNLYSISFNATVTTGTVKKLTPEEQALAPQSQGLLPMGVRQSANGFNPVTGTTMFVFDAIRRASHKLFAVPTQHPLQTGFNISDHIVLQPARVVLEVAMSDAIASHSNGPGLSMWGSNPSKSVAAFQQMKKLMVQRQLLTLNTRLETYPNMVLVDIQTEDSHKTYFGGLHMILAFQQLFISDVATQVDSARVDTTDETKLGATQPTTPDANKIAPYTVPKPALAKVPGSGVLSSMVVNAFSTAISILP